MLWLVLATLGTGLTAILLWTLLAAWQVTFEPVSAHQIRACPMRRTAAEHTLELAEAVSARGQTPAEAVELAQVLHRTAVRLLRRHAPAPQQAPTPGGQGTLGLTPPEALLIAAELQSRYRPPEVAALRARMRANVQRLGQPAEVEATVEDVVCPLLRADGHCATAGRRPIVCLARNGGRCVGCGVAELIDAHNVQAGISAGLRAAQLEGEVYEPNSALLAALDSETLAADWLRGAPVFAACQRYRPRPLPQPV